MWVYFGWSPFVAFFVRARLGEKKGCMIWYGLGVVVVGVVG